MKTPLSTPVDIDEYIAAFPKPVRERLEAVRRTVAEVAPGAEQKISYRIPTFALHGNLIHFAAFKNHIGIYPGSSAIKAFEKELAGFRTAKGTVQFQFDDPLPLELISRIVRFRVAENLRRAKRKSR
ncbi:MAG TPA: DUF1801 domain-containing protein [Casimicrobiaceae bacterium]|nr:DUF1801 domain-containing protein [Casimicrobiaceae bacterium]